jgi:ligand-binding sensor domain-containing protein
MLQDRNGYIWIGTQNGLNKYNGYSFEVYRSDEQSNNKEEFIGKSVSALFEDKKGNLWVGTRKCGINFLKQSSDRFINLQSDSAFALIKDYDISSFFEDNAGNIWITTVGAGVLKYTPQTATSQLYNTENSGLSSNVAFDIVEDKYGTIWVGTAGGGINYLQNETQFALSHEMLPNHPNMGGYRKKLFLDDEYLWVATEGTGLYQMNLKNRNYHHFAPGNGKRAINSYVVRDIYKAEDGRLFIATDGKGLNVYDGTTEEISTYTYQIEEKTALNSNALFCFLGDRTGNIWIGTYNGGINIYKPNKTWFEFLTPAIGQNDELKHRSILSIFQSQDNKIWVGTDGGGLNWLEEDKSQFSIPSFKHDPSNPSSIAGNVVKTIFEDRQQRLWIGLFGKGLDLYDPKIGSFQHIIERSTNVWSIAEKKDGKLWIATMGDGIKVVDPKTQQITTFQPKLTDPYSLIDEHIMTIFVDREDQVWIGTADHGSRSLG